MTKTASQIIAAVASNVAQYHDPMERLAREVGQLRNAIRQLAPDIKPPRTGFACTADVDGIGECTVMYDYEEGSPGRLFMDNGDPGYPDEPESMEVTSVLIGGVEVTPEVFDLQTIEAFERAAWRDIRDRQDQMLADDCDAREFA